MWYLILYVVLAILVFIDAKRRKNRSILWSLGALFFGPVVVPIYFAKRRLKTGETREGGTGWNVLKNFALLWTLTMLIAGIAAAVGVNGGPAPASDAEQVGAAIGVGLGFAFLAALWFFPMVGALVLGFFLKKSSIVEKGSSI